MTNGKSPGVLGLSVALMFVACSGRSERLTETGLIALEGATLIDGTGNAPIRNAAVILRGDRILRVGRVGDFQYPDDATLVDVSGRYLIPGLIDMHVHVPPGAEAETLQMLLAFGITTVRSPGSLPEQGVALRERLASGELLGPRMFAAGRVLTTTPLDPEDVQVTTDGEVRKEIERQAASGVDFIKVYRQLPPDLLRTAISAAHEYGLKVVGHLGATSWTEAALAGINGLLHSGHAGPTWELVPPKYQEQLRYLPVPFSIGPRERAELELIPFSQRYATFVEVVDLDGPAFESLVTALVRHDITIDPTLVVIHAMYHGDDRSVLAKLEPELAPPVVQAAWGEGWKQGNPFVLAQPWRQLTAAKGIFPIALEMVRRFHERGVRITAGTDVGMPWITPGVSLHRELEFLTAAGIPAPEVLLIATRNGAQGLGVVEEIGTIEAGRIADLVVLRSNPAEDIRNTRSIEAVYLAGRRHSPDSLLAALARR